MSSLTTNKALVLPTPGGESGIWGTELNNGVISAVDLMIGGVDTVSLSASNYTLSSTEIQNFLVKLSGSLLANITVSTGCIGFFVIENNCTGSFTVTIQGNYGSGPIGSGIPIGQGSRNFFVADSTVGIRRADTSLFAQGTTLAFYQSSAPVGWTQAMSINDYAMRIVSGPGGVAHAGNGFYAGATDGHGLIINEMPSHSHGVIDSGHTHPEDIQNATLRSPGSGFTNFAGLVPGSGFNTELSFTGISIQNTGSGALHSHNLSGLSMLDLILCVKS